jgi:hypothetical protein
MAIRIAARPRPRPTPRPIFFAFELEEVDDLLELLAMAATYDGLV